MDEKRLPDTPWHVGFVKKEEDDPRRHKARCISYAIREKWDVSCGNVPVLPIASITRNLKAWQKKCT